MPPSTLPRRLLTLHDGEETLYLKSLEEIEKSPRLLMHMWIVESSMDVLDVFRQYQTDDEDLKVIQVLGMRVFNAFASSIKLVLAGYNQTGAMIMRDILETVFLVDFFRTDRPAITRWRHADKKQRLKEFKPVSIREALDKRDGLTGKKREEVYSLFSELAAHASMQSIAMLRPLGMDARNGPFLDPTALEASLSEMGRLAVQVGEVFGAFFPKDWQGSLHQFPSIKMDWIRMFYPSVAKKHEGAT